jgi:hypothetical protein
MQHPVFPEGYQPKGWRLLLEDHKGGLWERR